MSFFLNYPIFDLKSFFYILYITFIERKKRQLMIFQKFTTIQVGDGMNTFFGRLIIFIGIWTIMMSQTGNQFLLSMFMLTVSLTCFFFLSLRNAPSLLYFILSLILFVHGWLIRDILYTALLFALLTTM